jgi:tetratricopeptide (TPR) repeat protein
MAEHRHHWVRAPHRAARTAAREQLALPPVLAVVSAHRRLRGPYTGAGSLMRAVVPDALQRCPEAVARHDVEILTVAPELRAVVPATRETLTSLAIPKERTRFYSRLRTLRIAHGMVEFLTEYATALGGGPRTLVVTDLHHADQTDREFLAVLVRRLDPELLTVVVETDTEPLAEPDSPAAVPLQPELTAHCRIVDQVDEVGVDPLPDSGTARAATYVASDGTIDDPRAIEAYEQLPRAERALLHDVRRADLEALDERSLGLGAIAWHAEHGSAPSGVGADVLRDAVNYCMDHGFYHAVVDLGVRGNELVNHESHPSHWWTFTSKRTTSLAVLGLPERSLELYETARALSAKPIIHMQAAYATAMMYTRYLGDDVRDYRVARGWLNTALAFASQLPDPEDREFRLAFNRNGVALIEVKEGNPEAALALLDQCIARLDEVLEPGTHALHRSVLIFNRAQVYGGLRRYDEALADYTTVIALDPNYPEYHFDRGVAFRNTGRLAEALADYDEAIRLSPPFPEAYYNRADVRAELGDVKGAVDDFGYVIELDPAFVDAYPNRAGLLLDLGDLDGARRDVEAGLELDAEHPQLLALKGQLHAAEGDGEAARAAYTAALDADPEYAQAWALRGEIAYESGDLAAATADLEHAVGLDSDPGLRFNLAIAYHDAERHAEAVDLLDVVVDETDDPSARLQRARSLHRLGRTTEAAADLREALAAEPELSGDAEDLVAALKA